jgi:hypothetical protein
MRGLDKARGDGEDGSLCEANPGRDDRRTAVIRISEIERVYCIL